MPSSHQLPWITLLILHAVAQQSRDIEEDSRILKSIDCLRGLVDRLVVLSPDYELCSGTIDASSYMHAVRSNLAVKVPQDEENMVTQASLERGAMFLLHVSGGLGTILHC
jgi:hypothetical protein